MQIKLIYFGIIFELIFFLVSLFLIKKVLSSKTRQPSLSKRYLKNIKF